MTRVGGEDVSVSRGNICDERDNRLYAGVMNDCELKFTPFSRISQSILSEETPQEELNPRIVQHTSTGIVSIFLLA